MTDRENELLPVRRHGGLAILVRRCGALTTKISALVRF